MELYKVRRHTASKREGGKERKRNQDLLWRLVKLGKRLTMAVMW